MQEDISKNGNGLGWRKPFFFFLQLYNKTKENTVFFSFLLFLFDFLSISNTNILWPVVPSRKNKEITCPKNILGIPYKCCNCVSDILLWVVIFYVTYFLAFPASSSCYPRCSLRYSIYILTMVISSAWVKVWLSTFYNILAHFI